MRFGKVALFGAVAVIMTAVGYAAIRRIGDMRWDHLTASEMLGYALATGSVAVIAAISVIACIAVIIGVLRAPPPA